MKNVGTYYKNMTFLTVLLAILSLAVSTAHAAGLGNNPSSITENGPFFCSNHEKSTSLVLAPQFPFSLFTGLETVLHQQKPDTSVAIIDKNAPKRMFLDQNYPNPFRDATSIRYGIPQNTHVKVTVHTMLGNPVKTLVDEVQKPGVYTIKISQPDLMSGLYFYRIQTKHGALTRRMTISKH